MVHGGALLRTWNAANVLRHGLAWSARLLLLVIGTPLLILSYTLLFALIELDSWATGALTR